jgi:3-oxoacyl-[acyl-carrier protein] reductase
MELGITGRWALVCGSSRGLGFACAKALASEGVNVVITGRRAHWVEAAAVELRALNRGEVRTAVCDITTPEGRALALATRPEPDILITNAAGPAPGDFREWDRERWIQALDANMLTPIELMKAVLDPMMARGFGRVVNITSAAVKAPIEALGLSNGARSGLTGFVAGVARRSVEKGVTINNLLPGAFATDRLEALNRAAATAAGETPEVMMARRVAQIPARRVGNPEEFGATCAFLCSVHAGTSQDRTGCWMAGRIPGRSSPTGGH